MEANPTITGMLGLVLVIGCARTSVPSGLSPKDSVLTGNAQAPPPASGEAQRYLDSALAIMQLHHINRGGLDWTAIRSRAQARIVGAQSPRDTYDAIRRTLQEIEAAHHSFLAPPSQGTVWPTSGQTFPDSNASLLSERVGYIRLPLFYGGDSVTMAVFARGIQHAIADLDRKGTCGWVVDLRKNIGGNMWPMLAGIGPILGEGTAGYIVDPDGSKTAWSYVHGEARFGDKVLVTIPPPAYRLRDPAAPVAVLIGPRTASSGEAIAISFRRRPDTRSFGGPTWGFTTAVETYFLPDSAMLGLTTAVQADRAGTIFGGPVWPDESVVSDSVAHVDQVLNSALRWLVSLSVCAPSREGKRDGHGPSYSRPFGSGRDTRHSLYR